MSGKIGSFQKLEPAGQQESGLITASNEPRQQQQQQQHTQASPTRTSPGALSQGSAFGTRSIPAATQSGPSRHQKLPSLSDVLENRTDAGNLGTSHQGGIWGPFSQLGRPTIPPEQTVAGGSPVSTASGYALSGSETDGLPIQSLLSGHETQPAYKTAPSLPSQPLLEYPAYR